MNAVEIEQAITELAEQAFDRTTFPFAFLEAFGNQATTIKRLKSGSSNATDIENAVLQRNNIHILVCSRDAVGASLKALKDSRATRDAKGKTHARFTHLIAEPDAAEEAVVDAVNDTLKAIAASLLMEQVLAPRFDFTIKNNPSSPSPGYDYGENGYDSSRNNVGFNHATGQFQIEINGLVKPKSHEAKRICQEDINEVITAFVQDKSSLERGLFDEDIVPEELTQVRMGKIVKDKYPALDAEDCEAIRQHAVAALALTQKAKELANQREGLEQTGSTALIDGVRKFAMDVRDLDIDLIDRINPFSEAYSILAKSMSEDSLKRVASVIAAKKVSLSEDEARELAIRALRFKKDRGRLPEITSADPWEKRMAEGIAFLQRQVAESRDG